MNQKNRIWFGSSSSLCRSRDNIDHENIIMLMMWTIMMIENWLIDWKNIWSVVETGWIIRTRIFFWIYEEKIGLFRPVHVNNRMKNFFLRENWLSLCLTRRRRKKKYLVNGITIIPNLFPFNEDDDHDHHHPHQWVNRNEDQILIHGHK